MARAQSTFLEYKIQCSLIFTFSLVSYLQKRNEKAPFNKEQGKLDNVRIVCKLFQ